MAPDDLLPLCDHVKVELREQRDVGEHDGDQHVVKVERHVEPVGHRPREDPIFGNAGQTDVAAPQLPGHSDGIQGEEQSIPESENQD